jgi:hypothetical protein
MFCVSSCLSIIFGLVCIRLLDGASNTTPLTANCHSFEECKSVHVRHFMDVMGQYRCSHIENITQAKYRLLGLTHIPKTVKI